MPPPVNWADDWPQWRGMNRDGVWNEAGIMESFPSDGLKIAWRAPVGPGFSSPVVAAGRVFVTDSQLTQPRAHERVHCFDAKTGTAIWTHTYEVDYADWAFDPKQLFGPRPTPVVSGSRVYTLGARGHLFCFDAATGAVIWKMEIENKSKDSAFTPSPLIEGDLLILVLDGLPPGPCVLALDKNTGREMWRALDETPNFSSPIVVSAAGKRQLIIWTLNVVNALDPMTGALFWREKFAGGANYPVSTPVAHGDLLLVNGVMFRLASEKPGATVLWPDGRPPSKQTVSETSTATMQGEHVFICNIAGELVCVDTKSGNLVWTAKQPTAPKSGASLHITPNGNSALLFNDQGELIRAELTATGYKEISRSPLLKPTFPFGEPRKAWVAPAYADGHVFARSDEELVCACLLAKP